MCFLWTDFNNFNHNINDNLKRLMTKPTKSAQSDQSLRCPHEESFGP